MTASTVHTSLSASARTEPAAWLPFVGRLGIAAIFILSGISKVAAPAYSIAYIESAGLPFAPLALAAAALVEIVGGALLVFGYRTRFIAAVLALFALVTAIVFHAHFADQNQFIHFFKNIAMAGGLAQIVAFGAGGLSLDARR